VALRRRDRLHQVADPAAAGRVALLCLERDPAHCHRSTVVDEVLSLEPRLSVEYVD
jgi:hypothetical protein